MNIATYNNVGITYLAAVVPNNEIDNYTNSHFPLEHIRKIHENTGIRFRRHVSQGTCASDLAIRAAEIIFRLKNLDRKEIDFLLLVTQTPDFRMPFTASIVHHKLNLRPDSGALDINLGCSGFVYGLELAMALVASGSKQKVLLINAETRSKAYSIKDKTTGLLFGDAASAVVVERLEGAFCKMNCGTDGSGYDNIIIPGGGYRNPSDENSVKMVIFEDGSERSQEHGTMNGVKVFNFVIEKIPNVIKALIRESDVDEEGVSLFVLHQANNILNNQILKKLGIPSHRVLSSIEKYGNTSSVSIPLTLAETLQKGVGSHKSLLLCGFGVGLSWAAAIMFNSRMNNLGVHEYEQ